MTQITDIEIGRRVRADSGNRRRHQFWCGVEHGWISSLEAGKINGLSARTAATRWGRGMRGEELIKKAAGRFNREAVVEINGVKKTIREWARIRCTALSTLANRYYNGLRGADLFECQQHVRRARVGEDGALSVNTQGAWEAAADVALRAGVDEHEILRRAKSKCPARAIGMGKMAYAELMALRASRMRTRLPTGWGGVPKRHQPVGKLIPPWDS